MSKSNIITSIKKSLSSIEKVNYPEFTNKNFIKYQDLLETFTNSALAVGANVIDTNELKSEWRKITENKYSTENQIESTVDLDFCKNTPEYINSFLTKANLAVAENGALWLEDNQLFPRSCLFLCQHLYLQLNPVDIKNNMFEAYQKIDALKSNFGTFISGPSKTADVEQCLVIGAHGPISLTIVIE